VARDPLSLHSPLLRTRRGFLACGWKPEGPLPFRVCDRVGNHEGALAQKVTVEFDQAADFSRYKTFTIRDGLLNSKNPALNSELVRKRIDAGIERGLTAKGLTSKLDDMVKKSLEKYPPKQK